MPNFTHNWITNLPSWLNVPQVQELRGKRVRMLEIGCFEGRGTIWFLENLLTHPLSEIWCVDPLKPNETFNEPRDYGQRFLENVEAYEQKVQVIADFSNSGLVWDNLTLATRKWGEGFDLIYIDGSHTRVDVLHDSVLAWRVSKLGTIICWDDYQDGEEAVAVNAFMDVMQPYIVKLKSDYQMMIQRIK